MPDRAPVRVLLLDDERVIVDVLANLLGQNGYDARATYRHADAIAAAREFRPDIFLTGVFNEPHKNGCETAAELLSFLPECRVLIFSGNADASGPIEWLRAQGHRFQAYAKPIHPQDLLHLLAEIMRDAR